MAVGKTLLILVGLLVPLCLSAGQNIMFGDLAATLVPQTPPRNPTLELKPLNINDPNQQWTTTPAGGYIQSANPAYPNHVWDVSGSSTANNAKVILYPKGTGTIKNNQKFSITAAGVITSALVAAGTFTAAPNGTSNVKMTTGTPTPATIQTAVTTPWRCSSTGDPHITPYPGGRNDIYSPGSHQPGTFTLSKTGVNGDPDYQAIQADQQACRPNTPTIYCNKRGIIKTQGQVIEVVGDTVTINGAVVPVVGTYTVGSGVTVTKLGRSNYRVDYPNGSTQFVSPQDWYMDIYISVTGGRRPTGGLCTPLPGPNTSKRSVTPAAFCLSWRTPNKSDDLFYYSDELAWRAANPLTFPTSNGNLTTTNTTLRNNAIALCAPLAPGSSLATQCGPYLDATAFHQACLDDVIGTGDYSISSSNIDAFSKKCYSNANGATPITLPTSGINSIATGEGLNNIVSQSNTPVYFYITAKDVNGNTVTTGTDNFVVTSSVGTISAPNHVGGGIYEVTYTPSTAGERIITILYGGVVNINSSPFKVNVESTQTSPINSTITLPSTINSGQTYPYVVNAKTASGAQRTSGGDTVTLQFTSAGSATTPIDHNNGSYTGTFVQNGIGAFNLTVKINDGNIAGSPFALSATDAK